jgi:hypothetical protein
VAVVLGLGEVAFGVGLGEVAVGLGLGDGDAAVPVQEIAYDRAGQTGGVVMLTLKIEREPVACTHA